MTFVYLTCLIIAIIGIVLLLGLTPDRVTNDILRLSSPRQTCMFSIRTGITH